jgi:hypothetical protein
MREAQTDTLILFSVAQQPNSGPSRLTVMFLHHTQLDTHPVVLLWTSDQLVAEAAIYTTHNKKEKNIHALSGIRTCKPTP